MLLIICFAEDVIFAGLEPRRVVIPVRPFVRRTDRVNMTP
jgi:hypothetical protein